MYELRSLETQGTHNKVCARRSIYRQRVFTMHKVYRVLFVLSVTLGSGAAMAQEADVIAPPRPQVAPDLVRRRALRRTPVVEAVEKVRSSVVNISSTSVVRVSPFGDQPEFEGIFGGRPQRVQSAGSGFVLHPSGYIVTNAHVVAETKDVKVSFADDRKSYDARVIAVDEKHDMAILKVDADALLHAAVLGTSSDLMIGETVIAIGNPFGFTHTVTSGVLSHTGRKISLPNDPRQERVLLQTDAAINPGNSGGPLLNILGEVIGINTAIRGDAQNIGFAIPVDELRKFLPSILDVERINRVRLGVHFEGVGPARITQIDADSPAAEGGLKVGDVVILVDNRPIHQDIDFFVEMMNKKPGEDVSMVVERKGRRHKLTVQLAARPQPSGARQAWSKLGVRLQEMDQEQAARYGLREGAGLMVRELHESGAAYGAGIRPGDIVAQFDGKSAGDMAKVADLLEGKKSGDVVQILVLRIEEIRQGPFVQKSMIQRTFKVKIK